MYTYIYIYTHIYLFLETARASVLHLSQDACDTIAMTILMGEQDVSSCPPPVTYYAYISICSACSAYILHYTTHYATHSAVPHVERTLHE